MEAWEKMKRGFKVLTDDPDRMSDTALAQAKKLEEGAKTAGKKAGKTLVPDEGRAAKGLMGVLGEVFDAMTNAEQEKALAKALREKEDG